MGGTTFTALGSQELSLKDLKDYPLICLGKETMTFQFYNKLFLSYGLALEPDTETATTDQILPLVKSELGLAFIPEPMAREAIENMKSYRFLFWRRFQKEISVWYTTVSIL